MLHILHSRLINEKDGVETNMALLASKICHDQNSPEISLYYIQLFSNNALFGTKLLGLRTHTGGKWSKDKLAIIET